jgi:hypothetical protein
MLIYEENTCVKSGYPEAKVIDGVDNAYGLKTRWLYIVQ